MSTDLSESVHVSIFTFIFTADRQPTPDMTNEPRQDQHDESRQDQHDQTEKDTGELS